MILSEYIMLGVLDVATIAWLAVTYIKYWDVITAEMNGYYWKARTNFTNAGIGFMIVAVINAIALP